MPGKIFIAAAIAAALFRPFPAAAQAPGETRAARELLEAGRYREALDAWLGIAGRAGSAQESVDALEQAVSCARRLNEYEYALELARRIPLLPTARTVEMELLAERADHAQIVQRFAGEDIGAWPEALAGRAFYRRGAAHARLGNAAAAEADLARALALLPAGRERASAAFALAGNYRDNLGDAERAREAFAQAGNLAKSIDRWGRMYLDSVVAEAELLGRLGRHGEAIGALEKVDLGTMREWRRAHMLRAYAEAYAVAGENTRAAAAYQGILEVPGITAAQAEDAGQRLGELADLLSGAGAPAGELVLAAGGKTGYQVVIPDGAADPVIDEWYGKCADLVRRAFAANGFDLPVARESEKDPARPALYLGDTRFARESGIDLAGLADRACLFRAVGRDLVVAGHDAPSRVNLEPGSSAARLEGRPRLGTVKAVTAFLREYVRARFVCPGEKGIRFLPVPAIGVPAALDRIQAPAIAYNHSYFTAEDFYGIANNYLLPFGFSLGAHTYPHAAPLEKYRDTHPEYFALVGGERTCRQGDGQGAAQYCISNPGFQELVRQYLVGLIDRGYDHVTLGQSDGFRACQCADCRDLYGTGDDWTEKLWMFHREIAERVRQARPHASVILMSYGLTWNPPRAFKKFPENTLVMLTRTTPELLDAWSRCEVPGGFTGYLYLWGSTYNALGYTPKQTPAGIGELVGRLHGAGVRGVFLDGFGSSWGLEGPAYYVYGRLWDDPGRLRVRDLLEEYCEGAFGAAAEPMGRFFDLLHRCVRLHDGLPSSVADEYGRTHRYFENDPMRLMAVLYSPDALAGLEEQLARAEAAAADEQCRSMVALVRLEFDYLRHIVRIAHLHEAFKLASTPAALEILLEAVDAWHAFLDPLFDERGNMKSVFAHRPDLPLRPFAGHGRVHVGLKQNVAGKAYSATPLNWDTAAVRRAPPAGAAGQPGEANR